MPNKAYKAQQLMQQLETIRVECEASNNAIDSAVVSLPPMQPNLGTYKNVLSACAFTSHASPRDRRQALEIALTTKHTLLEEILSEYLCKRRSP